jgi:hypothetical protein
MARLPIYLSETLPQGGRADAGMFGAASGQAMAQAGSVLQDIGVNMQNRDDSIKKTMSARNHDRSLQELSTSLSTEDMADVNTFQKWKESAIAITEETVANFQGTKSARAALREQLTNQMYQYEKSVRSQQIKAQHEMIGNMIEEKTNELSIAAGFEPRVIGLTFEALDAQIDDLASGGAIPVEMAQQYKNSGRSAIAASAIQQLEARGEIAKARELMNDPSIGKFLNRDTARQLTIRISAAEGRQAAEQRRIESNVTRMRAIMPDMTPEQEQILRTMPPKNERTPLDDLAEWSMLNPGKPIPRAIIDKAYGFGSTGGDSTIERQHKIIQDLSDAYAVGATTAEQDKLFESAVSILGKPRETRDAYGNRVSVPGGVPSYALNAMTARGNNPPAAPAAAVPSMGESFQPEQPFMTEGPDGQMREDYPAFPPQPGEPGYQPEMPMGEGVPGTAVGEDGAMAQAPAAPEQRHVYPSVTPGMLTENKSMMDLVPLVVGPSQALAGFTSRIPGFGGIPSGEFQEAKTRMKFVQEQATLAMRPTNKIADQYRRELKEIVDLQNKTWDTPERLWQHISALDSQFRKALAELEPLAQGRVRESNEAQRLEAAEQYRAIRNIVDEFNVPQVRIRTNREHDALPSGTRFFYGDTYEPLTKR